MGQTMQGISKEEINRSIKETWSSVSPDSSSIRHTPIRLEYTDVASVTYFTDVNKSVELQEN